MIITKSLISARVILIGLISIGLVSVAAAKAPGLELRVEVADTTVTTVDTDPCVSVYLENPQDTVAAFSLRILLNRPNLISFRTDEADTVIDTIYYECIQWDDLVCVDSTPVVPPRIDTSFVNGGVDTTGSLLSNWELVDALSYSPGGYDIKIVALAESDLHYPYRPGIPPGNHTKPLCRLRFKIHDGAPSDTSVGLFISEALSETGFSDPYGMLIGTITDFNICDTGYCEVWDYANDVCLTNIVDDPPATYDTMIVDTFYRYWICQEWGQDSQGQDSCLNWSSSTDDSWAATADSTSIDSIPWTIWNSEAMEFVEGNVTIAPIACGEASGDHTVNIADAVYLISYIFKGGPPPEPICIGDADGDGAVNIADGVYLINYIFQGGPDPTGDCCP